MLSIFKPRGGEDAFGPAGQARLGAQGHPKEGPPALEAQLPGPDRHVAGGEPGRGIWRGTRPGASHGSPPKGRQGPVITRAPRWNVRYDHAHSNMTMNRFLNPIREKM